MKKRILFKILIVVIISAIFSGCAQNQGPSEAIVVQGSDTLLPIVQQLAEEFMDKNPESDVIVIGGGSGVGIKALIDGTTDIADSSREIKQDELDFANAKGVEPVEHVIAYDGIAVIVNPNNPINQLTYEQIKGIYTGEISNWAEVGGENRPIVVLSRDSSSGTYEYFKKEVLANDNYRVDAITQPSNGAILQEIGQNPFAIGYISMAYLDPSVKPLSISKDGTAFAEPTIENVQSGTYPVSRPLYQYTNGEPIGLAARFIEFELSPEGQALIQEIGYVPAK